LVPGMTLLIEGKTRMCEKQIKVKHIFGFETGLISYIVRIAHLFKSKIFIEHIGTRQKADARNTKELYKLSSPYGTEIRIIADGEDEVKAVASLSSLFELFTDKKLYDDKDMDNEIEKAFQVLAQSAIEEM
jgi:phosphotransferase system HPr (HPr) family protein